MKLVSSGRVGTGAKVNLYMGDYTPDKSASYREDTEEIAARIRRAYAVKQAVCARAYEKAHGLEQTAN